MGNCARRDLGLREIAHRVAQRVDVFSKLEVQAGQLHVGISLKGVELRAPPGRRRFLH